jgi:hypothetical protein
LEASVAIVANQLQGVEKDLPPGRTHDVVEKAGIQARMICRELRAEADTLARFQEEEFGC